MENPIKTIQEKVNGMKGRLRDRLDSLPPRVRLKVVLVMFGLFALCSLYMIGSAIINFGNGGCVISLWRTLFYVIYCIILEVS